MIRRNPTSGKICTAGINYVPKQNDIPIIQNKEEPLEENILRPPKPIKKAKLKYHRDDR